MITKLTSPLNATNHLKKRIFGVSVLILIVLMMIFQAQVYIPKILLIFISLFCSPTKFRIAFSVRFFITSICICGIIGVIVGIMHMNVNPFSGMTLFILWPILSLPIIANASSEFAFRNVVIAIFTAHCFIVAYDLLFAITALLGNSIPNIYPNVEYPFSIYATSTRMNFTNLNSLTFSTPFLALLLLSNYNYNVPKKWQYFVLLCTLILFVISGRRSVMLQLALMPFIAYFFKRGLDYKLRRLYSSYLLIVILLIVISLLYINIRYPEIFNGYLQELLSAFDPSEEPVKFLQHYSLMDAFAEKPLLGHGFGALFYDPARNIYMDSMELQYQFTLARVGATGFLFYLLGYWGLCIYGYKIASHKKDKLLLALIFGFLFMLMSHATNPVLNNFDLLLSYFIVLARINYLDLNQSN